ncbi:MAG: YceI family protein [Alphaproteobacteria bacterium]|nr:MAG: YceI family protein [Alphaproteobacteria bacterium]
MKKRFISFIALAALAASAALAAQAPSEKKAAAPAAVPAPAPLPPAKKWDMMADKSSIVFHGKQMGADFTGSIGKFTPEIYFDEGHLDQSKVTVDIDMNSIDGNDPERNKSIKGADWFDTGRFPTARFETTKFTKTGEHAFTADANLTIHGIAIPVQLPFKLEYQAVGFGQDRVIMTGSVTLDRSKFQLGQGDWADPSVIANEVPVDVKVTATAAGADLPPQAQGSPGKTATP